MKGLNIPEKRTTLLRELKKGKPHFVFLQEMQFKTHQITRLTDSNFTAAYHSSNETAKSKGVSILVSKEAPFSITASMTDVEGRFVFIKGTYGGSPITLANAYFPNTKHIQFCLKLVQELQGFASGCLILGGDLNIPLNPLGDTSSGESCVTYKILKKIKKPFTLPTTYRLLEISTSRR